MTMTYPTLTELKRAKVAAMETALEVLARDLAEYAHRHGGVFTLFGSAARGELRHSSDVDILVDFPLDHGWDAAAFAEDRAHALGLLPDLQLRGLSGRSLLGRIEDEGRVLR